MPRGAADRLDQRALGAQEPLLVGVEDRDERHLGNVEPLAQQIDPDQHVEFAEAQVADDLDALDGVDVRVQVADAHAVLVQIVGEVLGHPLGERGDEHALLAADAQRDLGEEIVDLRLRGPDLERRIDEPRRPHELLDDLARMRRARTRPASPR